MGSIAGVLIGTTTASFSKGWMVVSVPLILIAIFLAYRKQKRISLLAVCAVMMCLAAARHTVTSLPASPANNVMVSGITVSTPDTGPFSHRVFLRMPRLNGFASRTGERLLLSIDKDDLSPEHAEQLNKGSFVACRADVAPPDRSRNPGGFDYAHYLASKKAFMTAGCSTDLTLIESQHVPPFRRIVPTIRERIRLALNQHIDGDEEEALFHALILGDRSILGADTKRHFRETGLMHVLAVSGLHVMLVSMAVFAGLRPMLLRCRLTWLQAEIVRLLIGASILVFYAVISGGSTSSVRASLMAFVLMVSHLFQRQTSSINALALAALVILALDPLQLFEAGFQLSFGAVTAILLVMPPLSERLSKTRNFRLLLPILVTVAATAGTAPFLLAHFGSFSLSGLVLNLAGVPLTAITLMAGILTVIADLVGFGAVIGTSASLSAHLLLEFTRLGHGLIGYEVFATVGNTLTPWFLSTLAVCFVLWPSVRQKGNLLFAVFAVVLPAGLVQIGAESFRPAMDVVFVDVGQGDAAIIRGPCGERILIDAGNGNEKYSPGSRSVYAVARAMGIRKFDTVIISHPHSDHLGGLERLIDLMKVRKVFSNGDEYDSDLFSRTHQKLLSRHIPVEPVYRYQTVSDTDECVQVHLLRADSHLHDNDLSIVARVQFGESVFLFTGDIESAAEGMLVDRFARLLSSNVVKVPHHGSITSSASPFVNAVAGIRQGEKPIAVVSVGRNNRFGLPDSIVISRWEESGAIVLQTAKEGAVWLKSDGRRVWRYDWN